ncbi:transposase [Streptomyces flaveolus]|uniref:transposase n=1 Tax=Streptomyces flaveolus TaxID=67297 RepID=UPI0037029152
MGVARSADTAGHDRPARVADRQVSNGMVCKIRTGISWRDLPERYGPWQTVYPRFRRYALDGVFTRALQQIQAQADATGDMDWLVQIDRSAAGAPVRVRHGSFAGGAAPGRAAAGIAPGASVTGVVGLLVLFEAMSGITQMGFTPLLPELATAYGLDDSAANWIGAVQLLAATVCVPLFGCPGGPVRSPPAAAGGAGVRGGRLTACGARPHSGAAVDRARTAGTARRAPAAGDRPRPGPAPTSAVPSPDWSARSPSEDCSAQP